MVNGILIKEFIRGIYLTHMTPARLTLGLARSQQSHDLGTRKPSYGRLRLKCDGTRTETRFRVSVKKDESI